MVGFAKNRQGQTNLFLGIDEVSNSVGLGCRRQSRCGFWHLPNVSL